MNNYQQLTCEVDENEDCVPILVDTYTKVIELRIDNNKIEGFSASNTNNTIIIALIVAIIVVVIVIIILWWLGSRARRRREQAIAEYEERLSRADVVEDTEPDEIIIVREARPYVVGYGKERQDRDVVMKPDAKVFDIVRKPEIERNVV